MKRVLCIATWVLIMSTICPAAPSIGVIVDNQAPADKATIMVQVTISDVQDLDTYAFVVRFDPAVLKIQQAAIEAPMLAIANALRPAGRAIIPIVKPDSASVAIAATLTGNAGGCAISSSACIGVIQFTVIAAKESTISVEEIQLLDSQRKPIAVKSPVTLMLNEGR
jgi:hypothetical protein